MKTCPKCKGPMESFCPVTGKEHVAPVRAAATPPPSSVPPPPSAETFDESLAEAPVDLRPVEEPARRIGEFPPHLRRRWRMPPTS
jgi:hypothetical protein